jgi:uncharacterized RDD family membrane protein YckC
MSTASFNPYAPPRADSDPLAEENPNELMRASRGQRFVAAFLDGLLYLPFVGLGVYFGVSHLGAAGQTVSQKLQMQALVLPISIVQWVLIARTGQSLGKRWTRIKIVKMDNSPIDFVSGVLLRNWLLYLVPAIVGVFVSGAESASGLISLADILCIFGAAHRCLHDYLAGTKVVSLPGAFE